LIKRQHHGGSEGRSESGADNFAASRSRWT
jgi:hypothetical protein